MVNIFPLHIFPQGVLSGSVITTVWVGVAVVVFFNLRLGWVLSGLVIPGYLVPLLFIKPLAALVVLVEGIITYLLMRLFSVHLSHRNLWSSFFGRERFFSLLLFSIIVRVFMDGWLLPEFGSYLNNYFGIAFDYRNNLHSFGLIIVALIANQFWKPGILRGLPQLIITVGITYLIVRYVLTEITNFNISNLNYMYADIAISMLASPKTYIILIITAYIASRMNLNYGWEFNGILIPALLTLQWYQPTKIIASFVEAFVILGLATLVLRLPIFAQTSMESGRKLLLFFNIGFVYKIILGYLLLFFLPHVKATDFFAFGYVLSTLIAVKMYDKKIIARLTFSTIQVSIISIVIASVIGYSLTLLPQWFLLDEPLHASPAKHYIYPEGTKLIDALGEDKVALYNNKWGRVYIPPYPIEIDLFTKAIRKILTLKSTSDSPQLREAKELLSRINYEVYIFENRYIYLKEREPNNGWGLYVIDTQNNKNTLIEVPAPLDERGAMDIGTMLYFALNSRFLAIAGSSQNISQNAKSNVLRNYRTIYHAFHRIVARRDVLQVRTYTHKKVSLIGKDHQKPEQILLPENTSKLWVKSSLPPGLNLKFLKSAINHLDIEWANSPFDNIQRDSIPDGFAELFLNKTDVRNFLSKRKTVNPEVKLFTRNESIEGYLQEWVLNKKGALAASGTNLYVPPKREELLFFDQQVLVPILAVISQQYQNGQWTRAGLDELGIINNNAAQIGYQLIRYHYSEKNQDYLILSENPDAKELHYRGSYIFRLGVSNPFIIQIPHPLFEVNSFEYGILLFETLHGRALLIAGANPNANIDKSADVLSFQNRANFFNLVNQVILRESSDQNLMVLQSRAFGVKPNVPAPDADVLVAFGNGATQTDQITVLGKILLKDLEQTGLKVMLVGGEAETAGYNVGNIYQSRYLEQSKNKEFAILWLSPLTRASFRQQTENKLQAAQFETAQIPTINDSLYHYLQSKKLGYSADVPPDMKKQLASYLQEQDVLLLLSIRTQWPGYLFERLIDKNNGNSYLLVFSKDNKLLLIVNLSATDVNRYMRLSPLLLNRDAVFRFIESRAAWLELERTQ